MARIAPIGHQDELTLVDHLDELRSRLMAALLFVVLAFCVTFWQSNAILGVITAPVDKALSSQSSGDSAKNSRQIQAEYQRRITEAVRALRADSVDLTKAVRELRADGKRDAASSRALANLEERLAERQATLAKLDLTAPKVDQRPITLGVTEPFLTTFSSSLYAALLFSLPFLLYQLYAFVLPAFTPRERAVALPLMLMVPVLFVGGVAFGYYVVLPQTTNFLLNFNAGEFDIQVQGREAVKFTTSFLIALGLMFQLPVGVLAVNRSGIVSIAQLRSFRRYAIVVFAVLAAVLTPTPDWYTMMLAWIPLVVLYELSIILAAWLERVRPPQPAGDPAAHYDLATAPAPHDEDRPHAP